MELSGVIHQPWQRRLRTKISSLTFQETTVQSASKTYRMNVCPLLSSDGAAARLDAGSVWELFCAELMGVRYRTAVGELTGLDLRDCRLEINAWIYDAGCFLAPHTDKEDKILSHLFYLVPRWETSWGGRLLILRSHTLEDCAYALTPTPDKSVILLRSALSWHAVEQVNPIARFPRLSVQVIFLR
ncbi:2OG-Fe(II) oxygenase [Pseudomonas sp. EA_65y_Pfl2_P74]|uniref:2OG-Fe(II) oxygenase n=1 Tax=Pseudomonas sp. EA_65y_Pfl2_P74 TaxID=3088694 RepID=UPI00403F282A